MTTEIATYLKYADLQIASEAFLLPKASAPGTTDSVFLTDDLLKDGNDHSSRFTETQAKDFVQNWTVVEHISNTSTGFSGTLFKALKDDPARDIKAGELVMSFRSTEFADDATRDNQATNTLKIKEKGWAFGQIADMEDWYASLKASGKIGATENFTVTGYSLGGHLATAFNLLRKEDAETRGIANPVSATYTFNGAGVGKVAEGASLSQVLHTFESVRSNGAADQFKTTEVQSLYHQLKSSLALHPDAHALAVAKAQVDEAIDRAQQQPPVDSQVQSLVQAMASFSPPAAGQTTLPANYQSSLGTVIAANWQ